MTMMGFQYDIGKCIGCKACQVACKDRNDLEPGEFFRRVGSAPHTGGIVFYSGACNHCKQPLCAAGCPTGAMYVDEDETVQHNSGLCIGCGACIWNCPYGAPVFSKTKGISQKCDACAGLRKYGQEPACVQACITHCLSYGPIDGRGDYPSFLPRWRVSEPSLKIVGLQQQCKQEAQDTAELEAHSFSARFAYAPKANSVPAGQTDFRKDTNERFVIIGNGVAGISAAAALRARNKTCSITLMGNEGVACYSRPMLTKTPLRGFDPSVFTLHGSEWYEENSVKVMEACSALRIDTEKKTVLTEGGKELGYDRLIIASGAQSFVPPIPGGENKGVFSIRTLADMAAIRLALARAKRVVLIGGGVIGLEAAWELKKAGCSLTVLEAAPALMCRQLDEQSAQILREQIESEGISVHTGVQVQCILGEGSVTGVKTTAAEFEADMVIFCCGIIPNTRLAAMAGAKVNKGIVVDAHMETTVPDVYACGDCAEFEGNVFGTWSHAAEQGRVAGANAAGDDLHYTAESSTMVFHGIGMCLFVLGDTGKKPAVRYEIVAKQGAAPTRGFLVNEPRQAAIAYEKYFFAEDSVTGGILIGDLSKMSRLRYGMFKRMRRDEFLRMMAD